MSRSCIGKVVGSPEILRDNFFVQRLNSAAFLVLAFTQVKITAFDYNLLK